MLDDIKALVFENLDMKEMMNYKFLNRNLLKSKLKYIQRAETIKPLFNKNQIIGSHSADIKCLVQLDYKTIATGSKDNKINLWNIYKYDLVSTLEGHTGCITSLLYFRRHLISSSIDSTIIIWDLFQNPKNNYRVIKFGDPLLKLIAINNNSFLGVSDQQILIFNYRFELINTLDVKKAFNVLPINNYLIFQQGYDSKMEVLNINNNLSPCRLSGSIQTVCRPILLDGDTIFLVNSSYELILTEINNPQNQQIIMKHKYKKQYYKLLKLKDGRIAAFAGFSILRIFKYEENLLTLVFDSDPYAFKHNIITLLDDGRIIASACSNNPNEFLRSWGDLRIINLNTFESICLQTPIHSSSFILQLKDKSIISITDKKTITKWF
jgi:WD40 repeat protein